MRLRQVSRPADRASWTEHFYSGAVRVENGEVEVPDDKIDWINQLKWRGFAPVDETPAPTPKEEPKTPAQEQVEAVVHNEEPFEPLGTQTVDENTELPANVGKGEQIVSLTDLADAIEGSSRRRKAKKETE